MSCEVSSAFSKAGWGCCFHGELVVCLMLRVLCVVRCCSWHDAIAGPKSCQTMAVLHQETCCALPNILGTHVCAGT